MDKLLHLLQFTEAEYNNHLFDYAVLYSETYLGKHSEACLECPIYWKWFTVQFEANNNRFVSFAIWNLPVESLRSEWHKMHSPIQNQVSPSDFVIDKIMDHARSKRN